MTTDDDLAEVDTTEEEFDAQRAAGKPVVLIGLDTASWSTATNTWSTATSVPAWGTPTSVMWATTNGSPAVDLSVNGIARDAEARGHAQGWAEAIEALRAYNHDDAAERLEQMMKPYVGYEMLTEAPATNEAEGDAP